MVEQTGGCDFYIKGKKEKRKYQLVKPGAQLSIIMSNFALLQDQARRTSTESLIQVPIQQKFGTCNTEYSF